MKYQATITGLGACALEFLDECCKDVYKRQHIYKYSMTACFLPCIKALTIDMSAI